MELKLEVVLSSSIKRKKPWPRFCWLGQEKESVFLLDNKRISEINMVSGRTKKRTPKLHPLLNNVVTMASSSNGVWLCGLLGSGKLFLWNRDKDLLKTSTTVPGVADFISTVKGNATRLSLQVSGDGMRVLLGAITGQIFLWECMDARDLLGLRDCAVKGNWTQIHSINENMLPSSQDKEASLHTIFVKTEALGDACLSAFVFTSGKKLIISCLKICWGESPEKVGPANYSVRWATKTFLMSCLRPPCQPVKSRGALVPAFSPDGQLLAIVLNQRQPRATQVLFVSTVNFVSVSRGLGGCGSKKGAIPSKYIRSYWVGNVSWSAGGLFLACVLKRGSLLMLARLGGLLTLSSSGCNIDFGPAHFLPLHPLVTYRPPASAAKGEASLSSSSLSVQDVMRQRFSVTWHPRLFYFIVSDGYMATVVRVLDRTSPALLLKTLLKDTTKDLEKASQSLEKSQKHVRMWLDSVSALNLERSLQELSPTVRTNTRDLITSTSADRSTLPYFLQDQGTMANTTELLEKVQTFFEDDSDLDGLPVGSYAENSGRLEFASMFDTLHALDTHSAAPFLGTGSEQDSSVSGQKITLELENIQSKLLTAWAFGMSLGSSVEYRYPLLKHALNCAVRFAALLHLMPNSKVNVGNFLKTLLYFIRWERANSDGQQCLGLVVELCRRLVRLVLTPYTESYQSGYCQLSSHSLSTALQILEMVSESLDHTYSLQQSAVWSSVEKESLSQSPQLWPLDSYSVPVLQDVKKEETNFVQGTWPGRLQPSRRLYGVWRWTYTITQQYIEELKNLKGCDNWEGEQQQLLAIMSKIQTVLQSTGEKLEEGHGLLNYTGEHLFLSGFYAKSADIWRSQLWEESKKSNRSVFQEKRLCLALLYSLLSQYHLKEAQELGDHMACLILQTDEHLKDTNKDSITSQKESLQCAWLPKDLNTDTAFAVVQSLGRFMASYFSNQPLFILPPHSVDVLPPIHLTHACSVERLVPLCQEEVARAVRQQQVSEVWTVEYAQDLLLVGGLLPETVWLAYHLGDWKAAVSLSLAYTCYFTEHFDFTCFRKRELYLPKTLKPASILQAELESLLSSSDDPKIHRETDANKSITDPLGEEDWGSLQVSIQEILKASVMAGVDVVSSPLSSLLDKAKHLCSCLTAMVPTGLYLPSPPLYCPQPSPNTQDSVGTLGHLTEIASRHKVSGVLQRLLLLLKSAHCCYPAAQWYLGQLRRARHILYKMKKKYSYPCAVEEEKAFPEGLLKFIKRSGYFRHGPKKDMDPGTIQTISCFRELCGLCWMLHVRDQLSISCRKYQADRQQAKDNQIFGGSEVRSTCVDAIQWARRSLPFARFLNSEEVLQDILLSLLSELPPVLLVADTLVQAFPEEQESVRVPLREKYNSLMQTIGQCNVLGAEEETAEMMMVLIQDKRRLRKKHLGRLRRHLAPLDLHLWEKEMEEDDGTSKHGMAMLRQLSVGTSLSTSSLTECGQLPLYSDGDTTEKTSEAPISLELQNRPMTRVKKSNIPDRGDSKNTAVRLENVIKEEGPSGDAKENVNQTNLKQPPLPLVGTWEFELEDDEYLNFLELFLSYVLEKDNVGGSDSTHELPLLKDFSHKLRTRELHSLTFDVLTTMHRRQKDGHHQARKIPEPPVFRAGCCFKPSTQATTQKTYLSSESSTSKNPTSVACLPWLGTGARKGLFGHPKQNRELSQSTSKSSHFGSKTSPIRSAFLTKESSDCLRFCSVASVESVMELKQGLDAKLEAQFPELGRLLEWMMRWADRRVLLGQHGKKKDKGDGAGGTVDEGVVIRVKASAPAVLTSLNLLKRRHAALLGIGRYTPHIQIPETQLIVAPVLQPVVDRESSADTGYPGSANTPITVVDPNIQQEALSGSCAGEPEDQSTQSTQDGAHLVQDQNEPSSDSPKRALVSQPHNNLNVTHIKEDKNTHSEDLEDLCSVSSEISCTPGMSLKLADLENSPNMSSSASLPLKPSLQPEPQTFPAAKPETVVHKEPGSKVQSSSTPANLPSPPLTPAGEPTPVSSAPEQTSGIQPPQMRQRLGDDLFRLVQNINYMSLMEVLGASFSNLQRAQQNSSLAQSNLNSNLNPNVPLSYVRNVLPQPNVLPVQTPTVTPFQSCLPNPESEPLQFTQAPGSMNVNQPPTGFQQHVNRNLQPTTTGAFVSRQVLSGTGISDQEMHPLSVQAESPQIHFREARNLIPCSEGLLTTSDTRQSAHKAPVAALSSGCFQNDPAPFYPGLKLLQLHPPQVPHSVTKEERQTLQNAPCHEQSTSMFKNNNQTGYVRSQFHFDIDSEHHPVPGKFQMHRETSDRFRRQRASLFPQNLPVPTTSTPQGLRLLQVPPVSSSNVTLPKLATQMFSRPPTVISIPIGETPRIKLLRVQSKPKMLLPLQAPSSPMARLIPVEELRGAMGTMHIVDDTRVQLLRVDNSQRPTVFQSSNQRQRRREKLRKAIKTEVTFRPNDSIIPQEGKGDLPNVAATVSEEVTLGQDRATPPCQGSLLTGEKLVEKALATAAELHAFASTCKRPPECHDAFTNTDTACSPTLVDKAVYAHTSNSASSPKSLDLRQEQMHRNYGIQDRKELHLTEEANLVLDGRQFISVLDLEDKSLPQDLPPCHSNQTSIFAETTAAQLHIMATTVLRNAADSQTSQELTNDLLNSSTSHPGNCEESASLSCFELDKDQEDIAAAQSEPEICRAIKGLGSHRALSPQPSVWFSSRMSELDTQLAALQHIADSLETDFSNSRMLTPVLASDVKTSTAVKKTVRLHIPHERWTPSHVAAGDQEEESALDIFEGKPSIYSTKISHSQAAGPSDLHTPPPYPTKKYDLTEISDILSDETLEQTGLSDTVEILNQLVREGVLSPTDLDLSTSRTHHSRLHLSRLEQQQMEWMSQQRVLPEDERRELRIWMRKKQRENYAVYQKHRQSLREIEHRPFSSSGTKSVNKNKNANLETKEKHQRVLDRFNQRTLEACHLVNDTLASPPVIPGSSHIEGVSGLFTARPFTAPPSNNTYRVYSSSVRDNKSLKPQSGQAKLNLHPQTPQEQPLDEYRKRLGLDRPVTSLPRDRLSQVTRRGMVTDSKSRPNLNAGDQKMIKGRPSRVTTVGKGIQMEQRKMGNLHRASETYRVIDMEESHLALAGLVDSQEEQDSVGGTQWDWLENLSETGSSNLSKIDWAAIERMVVEET